MNGNGRTRVNGVDGHHRPQNWSVTWDESTTGNNIPGALLAKVIIAILEVGKLAWRFSAILITFQCLLGVTIFLGVIYMLIRPFSPRTYRRLACSLGESSFLDAVALLMPNVKLCLTGDSDVPSPIGTSVLVCNHAMEGDWWTILMLGRCIGLRGGLKVFLRNEMFGPSESPTNGHSPPSSSRNFELSHRHGRMPLAGTTRRSQSTSSFIDGTNGTTDFRGGDRHASSPSLHLLAPDLSSTGPSTPRLPRASYEHQGPLTQTFVRCLLKTLLEFPCLSPESGSGYVKDRDGLFELLRDFAQEERSCPVQFLLFPEGWSAATFEDIQGGSNSPPDTEGNDMALRRKLLQAKSNAFAKREGRPQLRHLLLPRTTGFNASLESLRASSPVVYDVTIAYLGYDGLVPISLFDLSFSSLWRLTGSQMPQEVHIRIKKYSMEEVLQDASWLDKIWAEKDRLLRHFYRHQNFPSSDRRGFCKLRVFDTRWHCLEGSLVSLVRLSLIPCCVPLLLLFSIPIAWILFWLWIWYKIILSTFFPNFLGGSGINTSSGDSRRGANGNPDGRDSVDGGSSDRGGETTPYCPATPFATPMVPNTSFSK